MTVNALFGLGVCRLTVREVDEDDDFDNGVVAGHWVSASCAEYMEAIRRAGGYDALKVWSSLTDPDGEYGQPSIFTEWGSGHHAPVCAELINIPDDGGSSAYYAMSREDREACHEHAVFVADVQEGAS